MGIITSIDHLNLWAVLVAGICHMVVGLIWFQGALFGRAWSKMTSQELKPAKSWLIPGFIGHMLIALALAVIITITNSKSIGDSLLVGVFVWLCFVVTLETGEMIWEKIPFKLFLIRIGNHLLAISLACVILVLWK